MFQKNLEFLLTSSSPTQLAIHESKNTSFFDVSTSFDVREKHDCLSSEVVLNLIVLTMMNQAMKSS